MRQLEQQRDSDASNSNPDDSAKDMKTEHMDVARTQEHAGSKKTTTERQAPATDSAKIEDPATRGPSAADMEAAAKASDGPRHQPPKESASKKKSSPLAEPETTPAETQDSTWTPGEHEGVDREKIDTATVAATSEVTGGVQEVSAAKNKARSTTGCPHGTPSRGKQVRVTVARFVTCSRPMLTVLIYCVMSFHQETLSRHNADSMYTEIMRHDN